MEQRRIARGAYIFGEGEQSDFAYIVDAGLVEIVKATATGEVRLALLREGDIFGEMGVLDEAPRSAAARAYTDVVATAVARDEFVQVILRQDERGLGLLRALFERLRAMNQMLVRTLEGGRAPAVDEGGIELALAHEPGAAQADGGRRPRVRLLPLTEAARGSLPASGLELDQLPVRIGRKAHGVSAGVLAFNEIELQDQEPFSVSLNHLALELERGRVLVRDRGSRHGTGVNGRRIGGDDLWLVAPLHDGDNEIVLGPPDSPFRLQVTVE